MNHTGKELIDAIVQRLKDENKLCRDSDIVAKLGSLNEYEIAMLSNFGDIDTWVSGRNKSSHEKSFVQLINKTK